MVEQSTAASHSLAQEAQSLQASVARFQVGRPSAEPRVASQPAPRARPAEPARTPRMVQALKSIGRGGAAPKIDHEAVEDGWEEF